MNDVWINQADVFQKKQNHFCSAGRNGICVVSDWDRTLTYPKTADGQETTSYLAIVHGGYLGGAYKEAMAQLYVKYRGVELATDMAEDEKLALMNEWWMSAFELLKKFGLTREMVQDSGQQDLMVLREGVTDFFQTLAEVQVPLEIVSAGLGDVIEAFLGARNLKLGHVDVVANGLQFDEGGAVIGCGEPIIHSANKTQLVDRKKLGDRPCVLLLGDTLEDAEMVADFDGGMVIRVGLLNADTVNKKDEFGRVYDVVIDDGGDFKYVNALVREWIDT